MKISTAVALTVLSQTNSFSPSLNVKKQLTARYGYLDDISQYTNIPGDEEEEVDESIAATNLAKEKKDRYGVGDWGDFQDFEEFDGGDGQMGVAGDGQKGLEKMGSSPSFASSKMMSAKNAWGTSNGYAETLREKGVETSRAQQLENWHNQQEVNARKNQMKAQMEDFDSVQYSDEENWRSLAKFGIERNQEFDLGDVFGETVVGEVTDTIDLHSSIGSMSYKEFSVSLLYVVTSRNTNTHILSYS